jgi:hypothetical protein
MKTKRQYAAVMLAALALALSSVPIQAQTTNFMVYNFDTVDQLDSWGNFFGSYFVSALWDPSTDSSNNLSSGSMQIVLNCTPTGNRQYVAWDNISPGYSADMVGTFTNLSFDIRYDISSAVRINAGSGDGSTGPGSMDFGYMRIGSSKGYDQDWFYYFAVPATNGLGQPNTNWNHISIPINQQTVLNHYGELATITDILIGMDGANWSNSGLIGSQTYWVDNIQFIGPAGGILAPKPTLSIQKTTPALRLFGGSGDYARSQITSIDTSQSWLGGTYPVTYSFTLLNNQTNPGNLDTHIMFLPLNFFNGTAYTNTHDMDYYVLNELWLRLQTFAGSNTVVADISWKTNGAFSNPNHTDLQITNATRIGTWTLTFTGDSTGTLTAPGASPVPFTISDPNVVADFGNPLILNIGLQNNGTPANAGIQDDWTKLSISGVAGLNLTNDFTKEDSLDTTNIWDVSNSNNRSTVVLVPTNAPYWVKWTSPDNGWTLGVSSSLKGPWKLPEFFNNYADGTNSVPNQALQGNLVWALMPSSCLPTANGAPGGALAPNAFFRLSSPAPAP